MSEAVIRSAKNYLNQAGKPAIVDAEQKKEYNGNSESDFLDQAAGIERVSEADRVKIENWNIRPDDDLYLEYKSVYDNPKYFNQETGDAIYPGMNGDINVDGFLEGNYEVKTLETGTIIDRFGGKGGNYFSPVDVDFDSRALPLFMKKAIKSKFEVVVPFEVKSGTIAPWFDQPGMGIQFLSKYSAEQLLDLGWIKIMN